jgi:hypothetical protein
VWSLALREQTDKIISEHVAPEPALVEGRIDQMLDLAMRFRKLTPMRGCAHMMNGVIAIIE